MYCDKCGEKLENNSLFCGKCGKSINVSKEKSIPNKNNYSSLLDKFKSKKVIILASIFVVVLAVVFIIPAIGKSKLSEQLLRDWNRVETGDSGSLYELELNFLENKIEYNFNSSIDWLDSTLSEYTYKIVSKDKIKIDDKVYKISFNKEKTMMTMTPALTSTDTSENWFNTN